jgi:hypothetical protein
MFAYRYSLSSLEFDAKIRLLDLFTSLLQNPVWIHFPSLPFNDGNTVSPLFRLPMLLSVGTYYADP